MENNFDVLAYTLNLSPNQRRQLFADPDKYDISRLVVRDGVLYAPQRARGALGAFRKLIFGPRVDLIRR